MKCQSFACILLERLGSVGLKGTKDAMAQCDTIRLRLIKIGTVVRTSARRILLLFSEGYPCPDLFAHVLRRLKMVAVRSQQIGVYERALLRSLRIVASKCRSSMEKWSRKARKPPTAISPGKIRRQTAEKNENYLDS